MRITTIIFIILLLSSCSISKNQFEFRSSSQLTGVFEISDKENGIPMSLYSFPDSVIYVNSTPAVSKKEFIELERNKECWGGEVCINVTMDENGTKKFAEVTRKNIGQILCLVIDSTIISAPKVTKEINGGRTQYTLNEIDVQRFFTKKGIK